MSLPVSVRSGMIDPDRLRRRDGVVWGSGGPIRRSRCVGRWWTGRNCPRSWVARSTCERWRQLSGPRPRTDSSSTRSPGSTSHGGSCRGGRSPAARRRLARSHRQGRCGRHVRQRHAGRGRARGAVPDSDSCRHPPPPPCRRARRGLLPGPRPPFRRRLPRRAAAPPRRHPGQPLRRLRRRGDRLPGRLGRSPRPGLRSRPTSPSCSPCSAIPSPLRASVPPTRRRPPPTPTAWSVAPSVPCSVPSRTRSSVPRWSSPPPRPPAPTDHRVDTRAVAGPGTGPRGPTGRRDRLALSHRRTRPRQPARRRRRPRHRRARPRHGRPALDGRSWQVRRDGTAALRPGAAPSRTARPGGARRPVGATSLTAPQLLTCRCGWTHPCARLVPYCIARATGLPEALCARPISAP